MSRPVVIVTNSRDYATDAVIQVLRRHHVDYLRLDLDLLREDEVFLEPTTPLLRHAAPGEREREIRDPRAIFYRAPTHLRESSGHRYSPEQLLANHQWAAFARSLTVFRQAKWINHPMTTYAAENKPFQLMTAAAIGFAVPQTIIGNHLAPQLAADSRIAVKALDSFLIRREEHDLFFYTTFVAPADVSADDLRAMPVILQRSIDAKVDVRVTVVGEDCFMAETTEPVPGDWRLQKDHIGFRRVDCGEPVRSMCIALTKQLGLRYGAIDLARTSDGYWFFEINPTGEWAWLEEVFDGQISAAIARELIGHAEDDGAR